MFEVGFMYKNKLGARVRTCFLEVLFKGSVLRDLLSLFFSWFKPTWAPDKQSKVFSNYLSSSPKYMYSNFFEIPRYVSHSYVNLCGVMLTAETISTVCITVLCQTPWCWSYCGAECSKNSVVCFTPQVQTLRCASYRGVNLHGVHHTTESRTHKIPKDSGVSSQSPQCASHWRINHQDVHHNSEARPPNFSKTLQCASHR